MKANAMKKLITKLMTRAWLSCAILMGSIGAANAVPVISVVPTADWVQTGASVTADVIVSGLNNELIGAYDLTVAWDATLLSLSNVTFDSFLDGPLDSFSGFSPAIDSVIDSVSVFEVSFLGLLSNQIGLSQFRLFSLDFSTLSGGGAAISIVGGILGNESGLAYQAIDVRNGSVGIPEPASLGLLLMALAGVFAVHRQRATALPACA